MSVKRWTTRFVLTGVIVGSLVGTAVAGDPGRYADRASWPAWAVVYWKDNPHDYPTPTDGELVDAIKFELIRGYPVQAQDYMKYEDREFRPNAAMSRAEFAAVLSRSQALETKDGVGREWFVPYVQALRSKGIIPEGASEEWSASITRREAGQWMGRAAEVFKADDKDGAPVFTDMDDPLIQRALRAGIVKGTGGGRFEPDRALLRAEAAVMLVRLARARNSQGNHLNAALIEQMYNVIKEADRQHTARMKRWVDLGYIDGAEPVGVVTQEMADLLVFQSRDSLAVRQNPQLAWAMRPEELYRLKVLEVHDAIAVLQVSGKDLVFRKTDPEDKPWFEQPFFERQYMILQDGTWHVAGVSDPVWE